MSNSDYAWLDGLGRAFTRAQLDEAVAHRAAILASAGAQGDVIAICLPSDADLALDVLAAMSVGTAAPINPQTTEHEVRAKLQQLQPGLVVASRSSPADAAARDLHIATISPAELRAADNGAVGPAPADPDAPALLLPTSGTTGRSKLVPLTRANLDASARRVAASLNLTTQDRCLGVMPYYHVHGLVAGLLAPLISGGSVIAAGRFDEPRIRSWLEGLQPTWYTAVPTMHRALLDAIQRSGPAPAHRLRFVRSSSAPLAPQLMDELEQVLGVPVIEAYGMTEASHQVATNPLPPGLRKPGTVGLAAGTSLAILTDGSVHTEPGRAGEVLIKGPGVLTGYRDDPEATLEAFHDGWFRTGDLGELDDHGYLRLVGRIKETINRGGEKILPREVEEALLAHPGIAQAVAFPYPHPTLGQDVAAVVVPRPGQVVRDEELMRFVSARLPSHKVPRRVLVGDQIPLGPTGKPERNRMADQLGLNTYATYAPRSGAGHQASAVESIWAEVLGLDRVPPDVDFFALGGDSIRAMTVVSDIARRLARAVPLAFFADSPATLQRLEAVVGSLEEAVVPDSGGLVGAVSLSEEGILARSKLDPEGALYNVPASLRFKGSLDIDRLQTAVLTVVAAHEALRTSFPNLDGAWRRAVAESLFIPVEIHDGQAEEELARNLQICARQPFDLERGPLVRVALFVLGVDDHLLLLTAHHSIVDGLAVDLVLEAIADAYRASPPWPEPDVTLAELAESQRREYAAGHGSEDRGYWHDQLAPWPEPVDLFGSAAGGHNSWTGGTIELELSLEVAEHLRAAARASATTPFAVFLAAVASTLSRLAGATDIVIGTPAANRHNRGAARVVGMLTNIVPLRLDIAGDPTFTEVVARARETTLGALVHQGYPYEQMSAELRPDAGFHIDPLFRVVCQLRPAPPPPDFGADLTTNRQAVRLGLSKFDLNIDMVDDGSVIAGVVDFRSDLFDRSVIEGFCDGLRRLLEAAVLDMSQELSRLPLLSDEELARVVGRGPEPVLSARSVVELARSQAARTPEAPAVASTGRVITYQELDVLTARVAAALAERGVGRGDVVGVAPARDVRMVVLLLGVLRSGAAYLPLDPAYPLGRLQTMVRAVPPRIVIYSGDVPAIAKQADAIAFDDLLRPGGHADLPPEPGPEDLAYILFTSGSTGEPKAAAISHAAIVNLLSWMTRTFTHDELARVLVGTSLNFDFSVMEIYGPLSVGGCAVVADNVLELREIDCDVTYVSTVPSALRALLDTGAIPSSVQTIVSGGEVLSEELAARLLGLPQRPRLINGYGPTETTVLCSATEVDPTAGTPSIGRPLDGTLLVVMDRLGQPLPPGFAGELWVGGRGVGAGYVGDSKLTADRFVEVDLQDIGRCVMYRTGDRVRQDSQGQFDFLGRLDDQFKIRGMRVEPGDVEAVLTAHPNVGAAAAYTTGDEVGRELHAAVTSAKGPVNADDLRRFTEASLPRHMVPSTFRVLDRLPLTPAGKVDRRALASAAPAARAEDDLLPRPAAGLETRLLSMWGRLLGAGELDLDSDFFAVGGNSLMALQMLTDVERDLGVKVPLAWLLRGPTTIRRLAIQVEALRAEPVDDDDHSRMTLGAPVLISLTASAPKPGLFFIFPAPSDALSSQALADHLGADRPLHTLAAVPTEDQLLDDLVEQMVDMVAQRSIGPLHIAGYSVGGVIAYETASRLQRAGFHLASLALVDTVAPNATLLTRLPLPGRIRIALGIPDFWRKKEPKPEGQPHLYPENYYPSLIRDWRPPALRLPIDLLTTEPTRGQYGALLGWDSVHKHDIRWRAIPGGHMSLLKPPYIEVLGATLAECLSQAEA